MANLVSALGAVNGLVSNVQPTAASVVGNAAGNILSTADALAGSGSNLQATGVVNTLAANVNSLGNVIVPTATAVIGNALGNLLGVIEEVNQGANTICHITTIING
jgi:hypothetical protein